MVHHLEDGLVISDISLAGSETHDPLDKRSIAGGFYGPIDPEGWETECGRNPSLACP